MIRRTYAIACGCFALFSLGVASPALAQEAPPHIRFISGVDSSGVEWEGDLALLTPDSLRIRVQDVDTLATFARTDIRGVERQDSRHPGHDAAVGCAAVGGVILALGLSDWNDRTEDQGINRALTVIGTVAGCGIGALGGLLASAISEQRWDPWPLPDSLPAQAPPVDRRDDGQPAAQRSLE